MKLKEKFYNVTLQEVKEDLINKEVSFIDLDNYLVSKGFYTESYDVDYKEIIENENINYTFITNEIIEDTYILINFEIIIAAGAEENTAASVIKIIEVSAN